MIALIFLLCTRALTVFAATSGCVPSTVGANGFIAKFYEYPLLSQLGFKDNFFATNYRTKLLKTVNGITKINFQVDPRKAHIVVYGSIYGYRTTVTNYTVELGAFFLAPLSGKYTFHVGADNGVSLQLGSGQTCCNDATGSVTGNFNVEANGAGNGNIFVSRHDASFNLVAGVYYPIKIVHFNYRNGGHLNVAYTNPAGKKVTEIGSQVFQASFAKGQCTTTVTSTWTYPYTSTSTQSGVSTDTVIVEVPSPATTLTTVWTGSFTTTSTASGAQTNTVIVQVPKSTQIVTITWTNSYSSLTTVTGTSTNTVIVEVPKPTQTITTVWTGSYTTSSTVIGGAGSSNTVIVNIPKVTTSTTKTWSNSFASTSIVSGASTDTVKVDVPISTVSVASLSSSNAVSLSGWNSSFLSSDVFTSTLVPVSTLILANSSFLGSSSMSPSVSTSFDTISMTTPVSISMGVANELSTVSNQDYSRGSGTVVPEVSWISQVSARSSLGTGSSFGDDMSGVTTGPGSSQTFASATSVSIFEGGASRISAVMMAIFVPLLAIFV